MMRKRTLFSIASILAIVSRMAASTAACAADVPSPRGPKSVPLVLEAGEYDRTDVPVSVLIAAQKAQNAWVELPNGKIERAQVMDLGLTNIAANSQGKKELHFAVPKMAKGETIKGVAHLDDTSGAKRSYVWSGEPRLSRRLSCGQCHQGLAPPTADQLRGEQKLLSVTGRVPNVEPFTPLPTTKGKDFRWHERLGRYQTSACWECHGRHMVEYMFGQSLEHDVPWAPDLPRNVAGRSRPQQQSVYHRVFRTKGDWTLSLMATGANAEAGVPCGIHFGFAQAVVRPSQSTVDGERAVRCSDVLQQHEGILSEEAGRFIGRHCVLVNWVARQCDPIGEPQAAASATRRIIAEERRQLTVKNMRGRQGSLALWIDFVSHLTSRKDRIELDGKTAGAGFRFVAPCDADTQPEKRNAAHWQALTFAFEGTTYTVVCLNHPANPKEYGDDSLANARRQESSSNPPTAEIGYRFSTSFDEKTPFFVHYRLWVEEGRMPAEEIESLSRDFVEPIKTNSD